jgi:hypothetical protein
MLRKTGEEYLEWNNKDPEAHEPAVGREGLSVAALVARHATVSGRNRGVNSRACKV